jgi:hypothetical protein
MTPFVWSLVGEDAGETLTHIVTRKEAERRTGRGEFWWGLGTPLGDSVESAAIVNKGTLPALFSALKPKTGNEDANAKIQVWNGWHSIRKDGQDGTIPDHVLVTSGYTPTEPGKPEKAHYALIDARLALRNHGFFNPAECRTVKNNRAPGPSQRAALLMGQHTYTRGPYTIAFEATLVGPWYVRLTDGDVLTPAEIGSIRQYKDGDDWLTLVIIAGWHVAKPRPRDALAGRHHIVAQFVGEVATDSI